MTESKIYDNDLDPILNNATSDDLGILVEYLQTKISEGLTGESVYKQYYPDHSKYSNLIACEVRNMGGNSIANLLRGFQGPSYKEIVCDVAKKLKVKTDFSQSVEKIEDEILQKILSDTIEQMTDEEKKALLTSLGNEGLHLGKISTATFLTIFKMGGFKSYQLTVIIANYIAKLILGHGLKIATNATITKTMSILTGPLGWVITGIWTAVDIAGPAYKVTIPSVIHIAMLRKKQRLELSEQKVLVEQA